jgi:hypothetical protein
MTDSLPETSGVYSGEASIQIQYWSAKFDICRPLLRGIKSGQDVKLDHEIALDKAGGSMMFV